MKVPRPILRLRSFLATLCIGRKQHADPEVCTPATVPACPILDDGMALIPLKETGAPIQKDGDVIPPGTTLIICWAVRTSPYYKDSTRATEGADGNIQLTDKKREIGKTIFP
jgi:hypothetical protein